MTAYKHLSLWRVVIGQHVGIAPTFHKALFNALRDSTYEQI